MFEIETIRSLLSVNKYVIGHYRRLSRFRCSPRHTSELMFGAFVPYYHYHYSPSKVHYRQFTPLVLAKIFSRFLLLLLLLFFAFSILRSITSPPSSSFSSSSAIFVYAKRNIRHAASDFAHPNRWPTKRFSMIFAKTRTQFAQQPFSSSSRTSSSFIVTELMRHHLFASNRSQQRRDLLPISAHFRHRPRRRTNRSTISKNETNYYATLSERQNVANEESGDNDNHDAIQQSTPDNQRHRIEEDKDDDQDDEEDEEEEDDDDDDERKEVDMIGTSKDYVNDNANLLLHTGGKDNSENNRRHKIGGEKDGDDHHQNNKNKNNKNDGKERLSNLCKLSSDLVTFCGNDSTSCYYHSTRCNGVADCPNAEDESAELCGCAEHEFVCNRTCVDQLLIRCDAKVDCKDESDESNCETYVCPETHFKCNNHFCIPAENVCDFHNNCGDNSDEEQCTNSSCIYRLFGFCGQHH